MAERGSEIFFACISELNRMVRAKQVTALDLARAFGRRLEALGPRYNALALPLTGRAIRQAKAVDAEIKRGRLRGRTHSEFVQVGCHCPPGSPLEEPAKGCLVHVKALREFLEFNLLLDRK